MKAADRRRTAAPTVSGPRRAGKNLGGTNVNPYDLVVDRRGHERHRLWFPVWIKTEGADGPLLGVSHDASLSGIRVATTEAPTIGATVTVTFRVPPDDRTEHEIEGKIVRIEENVDDPHGLWPKRVAVEFAEPVPELEAMLEDTRLSFARISWT